MKKYNWSLGIVISAGISVIIAFSRLLKSGTIDWYLTGNSIVYTFLFAIFTWGAHSFFMTNKRIGQIMRSRFGHAFLSIVLVGLSGYLYDSVLLLLSIHPLPLLDVPYDKRLSVVLLRSFVLSGLYYFIIFHLQVRTEKQQSLIEIEQLKQAQLAANLSSLKEQLSPHFLFNTLNTLSTLTQEKSVKDYIAELANVYRYVLQYKEIDKATLQQELAFIESYVYIIKTRFEDAIEINICVDESVMQTKIPPLTLQLLIENAIKHNIASSSRHLKIEIKNKGAEYLLVKNNFQPKISAQLSTGTGLSNVMQRYQLLFNKEIIIENTNEFFIVKLPIV